MTESVKQRAAFSIGIDLGTTNCALAFVSLDHPDRTSEILPIPQRDGLQTETTLPTLPSFLYQPTAPEHDQMSPQKGELANGWIVGSFARNRALITPERVVHSAKSWLANHTVPPNEAILPYKSTEIAEPDRLSPLEASAALLAHLRSAWERHVATESIHHPFDQQSITLTVPASFDAAAQHATLEAARMAGFPEGVRLIEEPQAAFYRFLEASSTANTDPLAGLSEKAHVLVIDVGGGTSDFSLFCLSPSDDPTQTAIQRVAVSEHILLGGDNIDLALAHVLEAELAPDGTQLEPESWNHLVARSRELKERCLAGQPPLEGETLHVSVPKPGSNLFSSTLTAEVPTDRIREILIEGFFPDCPRQATPERARSALMEWGLPYASDFAVTRYLAGFLHDQPPVAAVLFNGGSLSSPAIRQRLIEQIGRWQGAQPRVLDNPEPDRAVARGAAYYGALTQRKKNQCIQAGAARAVFIGVASLDTADSLQLLCVLPQGAAPEEIFVTEIPSLRLRVNTTARFQAYQGNHTQLQGAGELIDWNTGAFTELPALETYVDGGEAASTQQLDLVPVILQSRLNELGLLRIEAVEKNVTAPRHWPLEFNLRTHHKGTPADTPSKAMPIQDGKPSKPQPKVDDHAARQAAASLLQKAFSNPQPSRRLTATQVLASLENRLRLPKHAWDLTLVRGLADEMLHLAEFRSISPDHYQTWLHLTGYFARPGFGAHGDPSRIDFIWEFIFNSMSDFEKRLEVQAYILWRRIAGGLSESRQKDLMAHLRHGVIENTGDSEGIRLAGALEFQPLSSKQQLVDVFTERVIENHRAGGHVAPYLSALGNLLSRVPFYATPTYLLPPASVEAVFYSLEGLDWADPKVAELIRLFHRAARVVEDPSLNLSQKLRRKITQRLRKAGVTSTRLLPLQELMPLSAPDQERLYGETLPPGLILVKGTWNVTLPS